jgi:hypothetical protein
VSEDELEFTLSSEELGDERARMLHDAAARLDQRHGVMGEKAGPAKAKPTPEGDLARAFADDEAQLQRPQVYRVEDERIEALGSAVPVTVAELARLWRFYWISFPVALGSRGTRVQPDPGQARLHP